MEEQLLLTPEDLGSNPIMWTFTEHLFTLTVCSKDSSNKECKAVNG